MAGSIRLLKPKKAVTPETATRVTDKVSLKANQPEYLQIARLWDSGVFPQTHLIKKALNSTKARLINTFSIPIEAPVTPGLRRGSRGRRPWRGLG